MPTVHLCGGEKGGAGKSFVCRTLAQYFIDKGIPFYLVETDRGTPDVGTIYSQGCKTATFSEDEFVNNPYKIYDLAISRPVIVNLPANVILPLKSWFDQANLVELGHEDGVSFVHWLVTTG